MKTLIVTGQMLSSRRRGLIGWTVGMLFLVAIVIAAYPSVRNTGKMLDEYMAQMPKGMADIFGLGAGGIASPAGYMTSQLYSNMYVIMLLFVGIGTAAWTIAGSEADGTLEMLLANPVTRVRAISGRLVGLVVVLTVVTVSSTAVIAVSAPVVGLNAGLPWWAFWSAGLQSMAFALFVTSIAFALGAATGSRGMAIGVASGVALLGFLLNALAAVVSAIRWTRRLSPWDWLLRDNPVSTAPNLLNTGLPLLLAALLAIVGIWAFNRRDIAG